MRVIPLVVVSTLAVGTLVAGSACSLRRAHVDDVHRSTAPTRQTVRLPLFFEERADAAGTSTFVGRTRAYSIHIDARETVVAIRPAEAHASPAWHDATSLEAGTAPSPAHLLRFAWRGGASDAQVTGTHALGGTTSYIVGRDPAQWIERAPHFARVAVADLYEGVSVEYYGHDGAIEYDVHVAPDADLSAVVFDVTGADAVDVTPDGDLVLQTPMGPVVQRRPVAWQQHGDERVAVDVRYERRADGGIGFHAETYDPAVALLIDPLIIFSTYLGGSGQEFHDPDLRFAAGIAVDAAGFVYVAGHTSSTDFPKASNTSGGGTDLFVAKISPDGDQLVWSVYLGGAGNEFGDSLALDNAGNVYVSGRTTSANLPANTGTTTAPGGALDAFVAKLDPSTGARVWLTYLGGTGSDRAEAIKVDSQGAIYVVGTTSSANFPVTSGAAQTTFGGSTDAFITKLAADGNTALYSSFIGGSLGDFGVGLAIDPSDNVYVSGVTFSSNFPVLNALTPTLTGTRDVFLMKRSSSGAVVYSTYFGGNEVSQPGGSSNDAEQAQIAVGIDGALYLSGFTTAQTLPAGQLTPFQAANANCGASGGYTLTCSLDGFVAKINTAGTAVVYATFLGGTGDDVATGVAVDAGGVVTVTGATRSSNFPLLDSLSGTLQGPRDAFVTRLAASGGSLIYSTLFGGTGNDIGLAVATDVLGDVYVVGQTTSTNFPLFSQAVPGTRVDNTYGGTSEGFVARIGAGGTVSSPAITSLSPTIGLLRGGDTVTISGSGFRVGATVVIGGTPVNAVVLSASTLRIVTPAHAAATVAVQVVNPDGQSASMANAFTYSPDVDGDGLDDEWEFFYFGNITSQDGNGDPDLDTLTNLQEFQNGTNPLEAVRYFAEGATTYPGFRVRFALLNPHTFPVNARLQFQTIDGAVLYYPGPTATDTFVINGEARRTIDVPADVTALTAAQFSTSVHSNFGLVVDRTMKWDQTGYGSHAETGILLPSTTWFLAEGATHTNFKLYYLLQNPGNTDARVRMTYLLPAPATPIVVECRVRAQTRENIYVNEEICPGGRGWSGAVPYNSRLAATDVSAKIEVLNNVPIIVERAMYQSPGFEFYAGHESAGVTATSLNWFLAEGSTGGGYFQTFVLLANPNASSATLEVKFLRQGDTPLYWYIENGVERTSSTPRTVSLSGQTRRTIFLNLLPGLQNVGGISTVVTSMNNVGILAERAMWWPYGSSTWAEAHNSFGATATGTRWALADGEASGPPDNDETYVLIANTSSTRALVRLRLLSDQATGYSFSDTKELEVCVPPNERKTVGVNYDFSGIVGKRFGTLVESITGPCKIGNSTVTVTTPAPIVVERAMYSSDGRPATYSPYWPAGTNALGTKLQ